MKGLACGLMVSLFCSAPLLAQNPDPSLERIRVALQQSVPPISSAGPSESTAPKTFGIFTLVPPVERGEFIRVSVPIGELLSRPFKSAAAANRRRQEAAAKRHVEAELDAFKEQRPLPKP